MVTHQNACYMVTQWVSQHEENRAAGCGARFEKDADRIKDIIEGKGCKGGKKVEKERKREMIIKSKT